MSADNFQSFMARFEKIAASQPERPAVFEAGEQIYTYGQLRERAITIAGELFSSGAGREKVVGLYLEKSAEYLAALLGIWYAGAAFVPLDPALPADRLQYMCDLANTKVVLHRTANAEDAASKLVGQTLLAIEEIKITEDLPPNSLPDSAANISAGDLAYIIFTSGSTGRPKGVMVEQRGILNFIDAQIESFALDSNSRALWFLSTNFDASVSDFGTALLAGAALYIEPLCNLQPGVGLEAVLAERKITHMDIPPSLLRIMDASKLPDSIQTIIIGGEACAPAVVRAFASKIRLVNVYGPTESTVCTSLGRCDSNWQRPLIGQPMPNIQYFVFDHDMQKVQPGKTGQLYIGGLGLARGYAKRDDLTAAKFVQHQGQRLYITGDLITHCADGEYQFLGRRDRQFKLRGMLVEPEEIENRLVQYPLIQRAAVLKRALKSEESANSARQILVAFIQVKSAVDIEDLRSHLREYLPAWMIPQKFIVLQQLPLTVTDKIDLSALQNMALPIESDARPIDAPSKASQLSPDQLLLTAIWTNVLGVRPEIDDNFFSLGGDSFAVVEAVVAAQARGLSISPALFMAQPTIAALTQELGRAAANAGPDELMTEEALTSAQIVDDITFDTQTQNLINAAGKRPPFSRQTPERIFFTGASGFFGARLLHLLLQKTNAQIYCLVRAEDDASGLNRIKMAMAAQELTCSRPEGIIPLCGDLQNNDNFGLSNTAWHNLCQSVDTIVHCAAQVNMLLSYRDLRAGNVEGTAQIARLMLTGPAKALHYASTLSVFVATDKNHGNLLEDDNLDSPQTIYGGYAQTKWAAEKLLRNLEGTAGPITYHRLGLITGDTTSGISSSHDFFTLFVRGIDALGCVPDFDDRQLCVDVTPVDYAATAFYQIASAAMQTGRYQTYHIANAQSLTLARLLNCMRAMGRSVETVAADKFRQAIEARGATLTSAESAAYLALCRGLGGTDFASFRTMDLFQATDVTFDRRNTLSALAGSNLDCPEPSDALIKTYLKRIFA